MSTSPDTQKRTTSSNQAPNALRSVKRKNQPGFILLKGILWLALIIGALVALGMNYEIVWEVFVGSVLPGLQTVFEMAEGALDSFYLLVGVGASFAPMATAYTGFVLVLGVLYFTARKVIKVYQKFQVKKQEVSQTYASAWDEWSGGVIAKTNAIKEKSVIKWTAWWNSLDFYNKVFAAIFIVLIGIPVLLIISLILGNLVASLI